MAAAYTNWIVLDLGQVVKGALEREGMIGWQYNTVGVSDAIGMGHEGRHHGPPSPPGQSLLYTRYIHTDDCK